MKAILIMMLAAASATVWAQGNLAMPSPSLPKGVSTQKTLITSDTGSFDNNTRQLIYIGHVVVTDPRIKLQCERLTVNVPENNQRLSRLSAETNVVIDFTDEKQQAYHVTSANALYEFSVVNNVTNETITFTGLPGVKPRVVTAQGTIKSEPLVWDRVARKFIFNGYEMEMNSVTDSTNGSPMGNFLK
jgi:lipopolysaccharide export system protein LptA